MAKNEKRVKVTLACEVCKRRNYITTKNRNNDRERIEMKKYCRLDRAAHAAQRDPLGATGAGRRRRAPDRRPRRPGDCAAGDRTCRGVRRPRPARTYALALRLTGHEDDARDVVQEAYLRAFRRSARFRGESPSGPGCTGSTANCSLELPPLAGPDGGASPRRALPSDLPAQTNPTGVDAAVAERDWCVAGARRCLWRSRSIVRPARYLRSQPRGDRRRARDPEAATKVRLHRARSAARRRSIPSRPRRYRGLRIRDPTGVVRIRPATAGWSVHPRRRGGVPCGVRCRSPGLDVDGSRPLTAHHPPRRHCLAARPSSPDSQATCASSTALRASVAELPAGPARGTCSPRWRRPRRRRTVRSALTGRRRA